MQLYAFDQERRLIAAGQASKETDYFCMECESVVRLRGGLHRQKHYFHLQNTPACRQNGKGMPHIHLQKRIQDAFPAGSVLLERRFPTIHRIGDAVHEKLKIVFEIQCSPISFTEMEGRNRDYAHLGYQVIWLLHDQQFNQRRMSEAEFFLQSTHYFTNIDKEGRGEIYDQTALIRGTIRKQRSPKAPLQITDICFTEGAGFGREKWRLRIQGDCDPKASAKPQRKMWDKIKRFYWLLFGTLLERATR